MLYENAFSLSAEPLYIRGGEANLVSIFTIVPPIQYMVFLRSGAFSLSCDADVF